MKIEKSKRLFLTATMSSAIDYTNPLNCSLHRPRVTNELGYSANASGMYSMYAPSCSGCSIGVAEGELFRNMDTMREALWDCKEAPSNDKLRTTLDAASTVISMGDYFAAMQGYAVISEVLKLPAQTVLPGLHEPEMEKVKREEDVNAAVEVAIAKVDDDLNMSQALKLIGTFIRHGGVAEALEAADMLGRINTAMVAYKHR